MIDWDAKGADSIPAAEQVWILWYLGTKEFTNDIWILSVGSGLLSIKCLCSVFILYLYGKNSFYFWTEVEVIEVTSFFDHNLIECKLIWVANSAQERSVVNATNHPFSDRAKGSLT